MAGYTYYTQEGYDNLVEKLNYLKSTKRQEIAQAISEARDKGDLSENAEYDAAKEAQGHLEDEINQLEHMLSQARVIDKNKIDTETVSILTTVKIKNTQNGQEATYTLVAPKEANFKEKKISVESPVGQGLLGKKVGEVATVETPRGKIDYEILDISIES